MIEFPLEKEAATAIDPMVLTIYSIPKSGKTTVLAELDKSLILDFEKGSNYTASRRMSIVGIVTPTEKPEETQARHKSKKYYLQEIILELRKNNPYKYIIFDTVTSYEDMCVYDATVSYMKSTIGKNFNRWDQDDYIQYNGQVVVGQLKPKNQWETVLSLPKGAGYLHLRESYEKYINAIKALDCKVILVAHLKTSQMTKKNNLDVETKDLNLTGKIKDTTVALISDSIGYLYREGNKCFLSFQTSEEVKCGSRSPHLSGKNILLSEMDEAGKLICHWDQIYLEK